MGGRRPLAKAGGGPDKKARPAWLGLLEQVIVLAAVAAVLSLTYLLFILMSNGLAAPIIAGSALEAVERNVSIARQAFLWGLWVFVIAAGIRHYRTESIGYATVLIGAACWLLLPALVRSHVPGTSAQDLLNLAYGMVESFQSSGAAMMVLGFLRVVIGRVITISSAPRGGAVIRAPGFASAIAQLSEEPAGGRPSLLRKCWELHFCRGSLRVNCPRYLEQRACWKARSGCYCDQGLATRLLNTVGTRAKVQVAEEMQAVQSRARQAERRAAPGRLPPKAKRRRPPCGECPIYLDHQKFKYRVLSWLAYPAAAAVIGLVMTPLRDGYEWLDSYVGKSLSSTMPSIPYARPFQEAQWISAENAIILMVGVLVAATILQLTEVAVFRLKL
jgi:hypothetical protein